MAATAIVPGAYFLANATMQHRWVEDGWPWPQLIVAVTGLAFGIALLGGHWWARWAGLPWLASLAFKVILDGVRLSWDFGAIVGTVLFAVLLVYYYIVFFHGGEESANA